MWLLSQIIYDELSPEAVFSSKNKAIDYVEQYRLLDKYRYVITKIENNPDEAQESFGLDDSRTIGAWTFFEED